MRKRKRKLCRTKKLRGENIFIKNDLSQEERKEQDKINRWAKEQRGEGIEIKIGFGRVKVKGIRKNWTEINQEAETEEEKRKKVKG